VHADQGDPPHCAVGQAVPAAVQPVAAMRPEDTGIGATPHRRAKERSVRSRVGLSPAVTSSCPAVSTPTPAKARARVNVPQQTAGVTLVL
jgi:hypothetical protein